MSAVFVQIKRSPVCFITGDMAKVLLLRDVIFIIILITKCINVVGPGLLAQLVVYKYLGAGRFWIRADGTASISQ